MKYKPKDTEKTEEKRKEIYMVILLKGKKRIGKDGKRREKETKKKKE